MGLVLLSSFSFAFFAIHVYTRMRKRIDISSSKTLTRIRSQPPYAVNEIAWKSNQNNHTHMAILIAERTYIMCVCVYLYVTYIISSNGIRRIMVRLEETERAHLICGYTIRGAYDEQHQALCN